MPVLRKRRVVRNLLIEAESREPAPGQMHAQLFHQFVARCVEAGLVQGEHMSVDGSSIQANADHHSRVPREQLGEVAKVNHSVRQYLAELEREHPCEPPVPQQEKVSTTDPDSTSHRPAAKWGLCSARCVE